MKISMILMLILLATKSFAYDERLMVNVEKANALLSHAQDSGFTPSGEKCYVELRQIEDGFYTVYLQRDTVELLVGLDIAPYGRIRSHFTKKSLTVRHDGCFESMELVMKENYAAKNLSVSVHTNLSGKISEETCLLPLN